MSKDTLNKTLQIIYPAAIITVSLAGVSFNKMILNSHVNIPAIPPTRAKICSILKTSQFRQSNTDCYLK